MPVRASRPLAEPSGKIRAALYSDNVHPVSASVSARLLHPRALPKLRSVTAPIPSVSPVTNPLYLGKELPLSQFAHERRFRYVNPGRRQLLWELHKL